jgi:hypothetical protein
MEIKLKLAMGVIFILVGAVLGLIARSNAEQDFSRLLTCFAFSAMGLGLRALCYWETLKDPENIISYPYYFIALIAIISSAFLGFHETLMKLSTRFFCFLSFTLFASMGFVVRTVLSGLIK